MDDKSSKHYNSALRKPINLLQSPCLYTTFLTPPTSPNDLQKFKSPNDLNKFRSFYPVTSLPQFETPLTVKKYQETSGQKKIDFSNHTSPVNQNGSFVMNFSSPKEKSSPFFVENINGTSPKRSFQNYSESPRILKTQTCNCRKSQCLKLYCECFSAGEVCGVACACSTCKNNKKFQKDRNETIETILQRQPDAFNSKFEKAKHKKGCNCRKSNCLKKYCECLSEGIACSKSCKCFDCKNLGPKDDEIIEKTIKKRKLNPEIREEKTAMKNLRFSLVE